jgi:hypothetical protein
MAEEQIAAEPFLLDPDALVDSPREEKKYFFEPLTPEQTARAAEEIVPYIKFAPERSVRTIPFLFPPARAILKG